MHQLQMWIQLQLRHNQRSSIPGEKRMEEQNFNVQFVTKFVQHKVEYFIILMAIIQENINVIIKDVKNVLDVNQV